MEISVKEYVVVSDSVLIEYYEGLINRFFKILPIFEGKDLYTKEKIYSDDVAIRQYRQYLDNFIIELCGFTKVIDNDLILRMINIMVGMVDLEITEHRKVKSCVFSCIDLCKKLKEEV